MFLYMEEYWIWFWSDSRSGKVLEIFIFPDFIYHIQYICREVYNHSNSVVPVKMTYRYAYFGCALWWRKLEKQQLHNKGQLYDRIEAKCDFGYFSQPAFETVVLRTIFTQMWAANSIWLTQSIYLDVTLAGKKIKQRWQLKWKLESGKSLILKSAMFGNPAVVF